MDTNDYMAFMESQLAENPDLSFEDRIAIEEDLIGYYHCLAVVQAKLEDESLSDDERENAWTEYQELVLA